MRFVGLRVLLLMKRGSRGSRKNVRLNLGMPFLLTRRVTSLSHSCLVLYSKKVQYLEKKLHK